MIREVVERALPGDSVRPGRRPARSVAVNIAESPLSWLHARGRITDRQFAAGAALHRDYVRAGLARSVTMRWDLVPAEKGRRGQGAEHECNGRVDARDRFHAAMREAGPGLADTLWRVVCAGDRLPELERAMGWPSRAGKLVLTLALDRVAAYYRVP